MKTRRVVYHKNLPTRSPITVGVVYWLLLDRLNAPGWAYGAVGTILAVWILIWAVSWFVEVDTDIFKEKS